MQRKTPKPFGLTFKPLAALVCGTLLFGSGLANAQSQMPPGASADPFRPHYGYGVEDTGGQPHRMPDRAYDRNPDLREAYPQVNDNWQAGDGSLRNGDGSLCWRDGAWTPATADPRCDGALAHMPPPPPPPVTVEQPTPMRIVQRDYVMEADSFFAFDSSRLTPEGQQALHSLGRELRHARIQSILIAGFTDRIGSNAYNQSLSQRRAQAARSALAAEGIDMDLIQAEGRGKSMPGTDCSDAGSQLIACLAPDRRVEVLARTVETKEVPQPPVAHYGPPPQMIVPAPAVIYAPPHQPHYLRYYDR